MTQAFLSLLATANSCGWNKTGSRSQSGEHVAGGNELDEPAPTPVFAAVPAVVHRSGMVVVGERSSSVDAEGSTPPIVPPPSSVASQVAARGQNSVNLQHISTQDELVARLAAIPDGAQPVHLDMRYNSLGASCLPGLLDWLSEHPEATACVGFSNIGIGDICRALMGRMGNVDWVLKGRLSIGSDEQHRQLDVVHARGFLDGRLLRPKTVSGTYDGCDEQITAIVI